MLDRAKSTGLPRTDALLPRLLARAFIVSAGVGVFEVGLALRAKQELGLSQSQIAIMITECSLVILIFQAIVFLTWIRPETTRWLIAPHSPFSPPGCTSSPMLQTSC